MKYKYFDNTEEFVDFQEDNKEIQIDQILPVATFGIQQVFVTYFKNGK